MIIINSYIYVVVSTGNLFTNPNFDTSANWIAAGNCTYDSTNQKFDFTSDGGTLAQADGNLVSPLLGSTDYKVTVTVSDSTGDGLYMRLRTYDEGSGYTNLNSYASYANGTHEITFTTPSDILDGGVEFYVSGVGEAGKLDDVKLELN